MGIFNLRLKEETHQKIKIIADKQSRSQNKQVEHIINQFISDYEKINGAIKIEDEYSSFKV